MNEPGLMRWNQVFLETIAYELPEERLGSAQLEERLAPFYKALHLSPGQLEALTGIKERRVWPVRPAPRMSECAARAGRKALEQAGLSGADLGAVVYAGVCRDNLEPATACAVADALGVGPQAMVFDVSNACLGVMNGMVEVANRIQLGQIQAGLVVSSESSREIIDTTIERMLRDPTLDSYRLCLATLTGGSGAVAVLLTSASLARSGHQLQAAASLTAVEHHRICRWGPARGLLGETPNVMDTDATKVLTHGVDLARRTWERFQQAAGWQVSEVDRVICHQVGGGHRKSVLKALGVDPEREFPTYENLGNIGTVALPMTAAMAHEQGFLQPGHKVGFLGIGSGLSCLMLAVRW